jgi:hypothetical protein
MPCLAISSPRSNGVARPLGRRQPVYERKSPAPDVPGNAECWALFLGYCSLAADRDRSVRERMQTFQLVIRQVEISPEALMN